MTVVPRIGQGDEHDDHVNNIHKQGPSLKAIGKLRHQEVASPESIGTNRLR